MRSCRISKQVLASPDCRIMVVRLLKPASDKSLPTMTGRTPVKRGLLHEALVMEAITQVPQCLTICHGGWSFHVNPDATAGRGDDLREYRCYLWKSARVLFNRQRL
ncbi:hypothetical protein AVEN_216173-1 [Araneus ventricosus]|uniref:Uncharacterized protein n=1 Tax=Araneus ventricosus TaxID=182803 RepID=A0A4Y2KDB4_ARAVE|nr:hypothetical protein AVEN_216173-1 [Araneus ventricosus]